MRRQFKGNVLSTTLSNLMNPGDTTAVLVDGSTFPDASIGPFVVTVNAGGASEEKMLVGARSGNNLTSITRGYDGTSAGTHQAGEKVTHTLAAVDLDEANAHVNASTGVHGLSGAVVGTTDSQTLTNKTLTNVTISGTVTQTNWNVDASGNINTNAALTASTALNLTGNANLINFAPDTTDPGAPSSNHGYLYVVNGALKFRGGSGTITTIAPA